MNHKKPERPWWMPHYDVLMDENSTGEDKEASIFALINGEEI